MSTTNLVFLAFKIFSLVILINQVSSDDYSALLSRLYKRAAAADRPLIVLIDSNLLQSERQTNRKPSVLDAIGFNRLANREAPISTLLPKPKKFRNKVSSRPLDRYDIEKQLHPALVPMQKRVTREKEILRSPIIRNLLRISNNLRCQARTKCEDQCNNKYSGPKNNKCINTCEKKYDCDEAPPESGCDDCDANSCDNECEGSTKGYAETDPPAECPQC